VIFCCLDLYCITGAIRAGVSDALRAQIGAAFNDASLVLTATPTHSGPGGCSFEALYNIPTPGFVPEHLATVVVASASSIISASQTALDTELSLQRSCFAEDIPVASPARCPCRWMS
jgi:neutral ceramidase